MHALNRHGMRWRTTLTTVGAMAAIGVGLLLAGYKAGAVSPVCDALSQTTIRRAGEVLKRKNKIDPRTQLTFSGSAPLAGTCIRRLTYIAPDLASPLKILVSNDQLYALASATRLSTALPGESEANDTGLNLTASNSGGTLEASAEMRDRSFEIRGEKNASTTMFIFSDFECPFCSALAKTLNESIFAAHQHDVRFVYVNFPLPSHSWARVAAKAGICVALQNNDSFWRLHDFLFERQTVLTYSTISASMDDFVRRQKAIDISKYRACVVAPSTDTILDADIALGTRIGVNSTPTLFVKGRVLLGAASPAKIEAILSQ